MAYISKYDYIIRAKNENWLVCTYCLGYLGKRLRKTIPELFGLKAGLYCDSSNATVDRSVISDAKPIYREDLKNAAEPVIVFILTDDPYDIEIQKDLSINENLYTFTLRELVLMDQVIKDFYGEELFEMYKKL